MKHLKLIGFLTCLLIMGLVVGANAQTIKQDAAGNYYAVKASKDSTGDNPTGKIFTNAAGETFPVFQSKSDKLYIIRVAKISGKSYRQYLKL